jgi:hypothetical protein
MNKRPKRTPDQVHKWASPKMNPKRVRKAMDVIPKENE